MIGSEGRRGHGPGRKVSGGARPRRRRVDRRDIRLERLEDRQLLSIDLSLVDAQQLVMTGDATASSLSVTYDPSNETFNFTANSGETFTADASVPASVTFASSGNTATLSPTSGSWSSLGYSLGVDMIEMSSVTVGGSGMPASNFPVPFDVADSGGAQIALTIDDSANTTGETVDVTAFQASFVGGPTFDYTDASLSGLTLDAADAGSNTVDVLGTPAASNPLGLNMGTGSGNSISLGDAGAMPASYAAQLGDVTITTGTGGSTGLTIDDSADTSGGTEVLQFNRLLVRIPGGDDLRLQRGEPREPHLRGALHDEPRGPGMEHAVALGT